MPSSRGSSQPQSPLHLLHWQVGSFPLVPPGKSKSEQVLSNILLPRYLIPDNSPMGLFYLTSRSNKFNLFNYMYIHGSLWLDHINNTYGFFIFRHLLGGKPSCCVSRPITLKSSGCEEAPINSQ